MLIVDRMPIRWRLTAAYGLTCGLLFGICGIGIYRYVAYNLLQSVDAALVASGHAIRDARTVRGFDIPMLESLLEGVLEQRWVRPYAQLVDFSGKVRTKTPNVTVTLPISDNAVARAELGHETLETFKLAGGGALRQLTLPVMVRGRFSGELIQVGAPLDPAHHALTNIRLALWIAFPLTLAIALLLGHGLTGRSLRRVSAISQAASEIGSEDLRVRLPVPSARDEFRTLTVTFNQMFDRLADAFGRLRRFSGDVSHELRTPLAVLQSEVDLALRRPRSQSEYVAALKNIESEIGHMTQVVDELLLLARAQSGSLAIQRTEVSSQDLVKSVLTSIDGLARAKNVRFDFVPEGPLGPLMLSELHTTLALKNILLNAIKHSPEGGTVQIISRTDHDQGLWQVDIRDQGEGVAEEDRPFIFDPFYRSDSARNRAAGGVGLGLPLARALMSLQGGQVAYVEGSQWKGATFRMTLPMEPALGQQERLSTRTRSEKDVEYSPPLHAPAPPKRLSQEPALTHA